MVYLVSVVDKPSSLNGTICSSIMLIFYCFLPLHKWRNKVSLLSLWAPLICMVIYIPWSSFQATCIVTICSVWELGHIQNIFWLVWGYTWSKYNIYVPYRRFGYPGHFAYCADKPGRCMYSWCLMVVAVLSLLNFLFMLLLLCSFFAVVVFVVVEFE